MSPAHVQCLSMSHTVETTSLPACSNSHLRVEFHRRATPELSQGSRRSSQSVTGKEQCWTQSDICRDWYDIHLPSDGELVIPFEQARRSGKTGSAHSSHRHHAWSRRSLRVPRPRFIELGQAKGEAGRRARRPTECEAESVAVSPRAPRRFTRSLQCCSPACTVVRLAEDR